MTNIHQMNIPSNIHWKICSLPPFEACIKQHYHSISATCLIPLKLSPSAHFLCKTLSELSKAWAQFSGFLVAPYAVARDIHLPLIFSNERHHTFQSILSTIPPLPTAYYAVAQLIKSIFLWVNLDRTIQSVLSAITGLPAARFIVGRFHKAVTDRICPGPNIDQPKACPVQCCAFPLFATPWVDSMENPQKWKS